MRRCASIARFGLKVAGESENYDVEQEHLNNVFGARLRITALRAAAGPGIEFLEYLAPRDGRPAPLDLKANDIAHWETTLVAADLAPLLPLARRHLIALVSPGPVDEPADSRRFRSGALTRDPDGHGLRIAVRVVVLSCELCGRSSTPLAMAEAGWLDARVIARLERAHPGWRRADGACPACVQEAVLEDVLIHGRAALEGHVQAIWPLDAEAAFGAIPTPLRLRADPRFTGHGTTIALVDAGFFPHPDLVRPTNRIVAWVDASEPRVVSRSFSCGRCADVARDARG